MSEHDKPASSGAAGSQQESPVRARAGLMELVRAKLVARSLMREARRPDNAASLTSIGVTAAVIAGLLLAYALAIGVAIGLAIAAGRKVWPR